MVSGFRLRVKLRRTAVASAEAVSPGMAVSGERMRANDEELNARAVSADKISTKSGFTERRILETPGLYRERPHERDPRGRSQMR